MKYVIILIILTLIILLLISFIFINLIGYQGRGIGDRYENPNKPLNKTERIIFRLLRVDRESEEETPKILRQFRLKRRT